MIRKKLLYNLLFRQMCIPRRSFIFLTRLGPLRVNAQTAVPLSFKMPTKSAF
jgi:hypothetical protein